jgi:hypothetical protein
VQGNSIFIVGFRHSGTTLLMNLLNYHPHVDRIYFEKDLITVAPDESWLKSYVKGRFKRSWGDKLPWYKDSGEVVVEKCRKWLKYFRPNARIIHIIRHPIDAALSNTLHNPDPNLVKIQLDKYSKSIPLVIDFINSSRFAINLSFEDLALEPNKTLNKVYSFCDLESNSKILKSVQKKIIGGVKQSKAFVHKQRNLEYDIPHFTYEEIRERANFI